MPGITVAITGPQGEYSVKTDASGHYELNGVVPGSYKVVVEATGFKKFISDHNQIVVDHSGIWMYILHSAPPPTRCR